MILWIAYQGAGGSDVADDIHQIVRGAAGKVNVFRAVNGGWLVDTDESPGQWLDKFDDVIKGKDKVLVTKLQRGAGAVNMTEATDWLKEHRESF